VITPCGVVTEYRARAFAEQSHKGIKVQPASLKVDHQQTTKGSRGPPPGQLSHFLTPFAESGSSFFKQPAEAFILHDPFLFYHKHIFLIYND
jgi:hypothetical protein